MISAVSMEKPVREALETLRKGGVILYPTDTIWGIGCDATQEKAVEKVFRVKNRHDAKSLIILVADFSEIEEYVQYIPPGARELAASSGKPLTLIYPGARNLASNVVGDDGSIAIRVVKHAFCEALIRALGKPLVSTSANLSGAPHPHTSADIAPAILLGVDYVVNLPSGLANPKPSTIIKLDSQGQQTLIRP